MTDALARLEETGAGPATEDKTSPRSRVGLIAFLLVPLGVLLVALGDEAGRAGGTAAAPLFWAGLVTIFAPAAWTLWHDRPSRGEAVTLLLAVALGLYVANLLRSPGMLTDYDELLHFRTLDDIVRSGRLFADNPLLPVSPHYPGLEIVTHALGSATGLGPIVSGIVVIGVARALLVVSLFLFLERVVSPARLAALGTLLYMAAPSFFAFDAAFAYESFALPLAVFSLYVLRRAQTEDGRRRVLLDAAGALAALAVVATHHVTSFILAAVMIAWTGAVLVARRVRGVPEPLPGGGWVPALTVAAVLVWVTRVAPVTVEYLAPHAASAWREVLRILAGQGLGRRLFESSAGMNAAVLERAVGIASVLLTLAVLPFGVKYVRSRQRGEVFAAFLLLSVLAYPASLALRFTKSGWEIGSRSAAFICVPLAFVLGSGFAHLRAAGGGRRWTPLVATAAMTVMFLGGVIAGTSPVNRMPRPYNPGAYDASIEGEGLAAADWAKNVLGRGNRFVADSTNASLMGSFGRQTVLTSSDGVSLSGFFLLPWGGYQREMIARNHVEYTVVDRRIPDQVPLSGFFYEKWEREIAPYDFVVEASTLSRFDDLTDVDRVYDSGGVQIYDVRRLGW